MSDKKNISSLSSPRIDDIVKVISPLGTQHKTRRGVSRIKSSSQASDQIHDISKLRRSGQQSLLTEGVRVQYVEGEEPVYVGIPSNSNVSTLKLVIIQHYFSKNISPTEVSLWKRSEVTGEEEKMDTRKFLSEYELENDIIVPKLSFSKINRIQRKYPAAPNPLRPSSRLSSPKSTERVYSAQYFSFALPFHETKTIALKPNETLLSAIEQYYCTPRGISINEIVAYDVHNVEINMSTPLGQIEKHKVQIVKKDASNKNTKLESQQSTPTKELIVSFANEERLSQSSTINTFSDKKKAQRKSDPSPYKKKIRLDLELGSPRISISPENYLKTSRMDSPKISNKLTVIAHKIFSLINIPNSKLIKDQEFKNKLYYSCLLGNDLVNVLTQDQGYSRKDAVEIGNILINENLIQPILPIMGNQFKDDNSLYQVTWEAIEEDLNNNVPWFQIKNTKQRLEELKNYSSSALMKWLQENNLEEFIGIFQQDSVAIPNTSGLQFKLDPKKNNQIVLAKGCQEKILELLLVKPDSPLFAIFDYQKFVQVFFITYPSFISAIDLLDYFRKRFLDTKSDKSMKDTILSLTKTWILTDRAADFVYNSELKQKLEKFCKEIVNQTNSPHREMYEKITWNFMELTKEKIIITKAKTIPDKLHLKVVLEEYREQFIDYLNQLKLVNIKLINFFNDLHLFKIDPTEDKAEHLLQVYLSKETPVISVNSYAMDSILQNKINKNISKHLFNQVVDDIDQHLQAQIIPDFLKHLKSLLSNPNSTKPILPKKENFNLEDVEPVELARQISLILMNYFRNIRRTEFLNKNYENSDLSPNITKVKDFHYHLENVVNAEILKNPFHEGQAAAISYFVEVSEELFKQNNFLALGSILGGLLGSAIQKLKVSHSLLDKKTLSKLERLSQIIRRDDQFQLYYQALSIVPDTNPVIPLLHAAKGLPALVKLNEIEPDLLSDPPGWINWHKMIIISKIIRDIMKPRQPYQFQRIPKIQKLVKITENWPHENINCKIAILRNSTTTWNHNVSKLFTSQLWDTQWSDLTETDWKIIISSTQAQNLTFDENSVIIDANEDNRSIYRLVSGDVTIVKNQVGLPPILKSPNTFGELSMFLQKPVPSKIIAETKSTIYKIPVNSLIKLCLTDSEISRKFNYYIAWKLARRMKRKLEDSKMRRSMDIIRIPKFKSENLTKEKEKKLKELIGDNHQIFGEFECTHSSTKKRTGKLVLTDKCLFFKGKAFGSKKIVPIPIRCITSLELAKGRIKLNMNISGTNEVIKIQNTEKIEEINQIIESLRKEFKTIPTSVEVDKLGDKPNPTVDKSTNNTLELSEDDWKLIIKGAKNVRVKGGEIIVNIGDKIKRLYQIVNGSVEISSGTKQVILPKKEIFGEMAFLNEEGISTFSVKALEKTDIVVIESYYLDVLFQHFPPLAGRFYHYLAQILCKRLVDVGYY